MSDSKTSRRLAGGIIAIIVLSICLAATTFALVYTTVFVENNYFHTGQVELNLNDGKPVIQAHEFIFEPGMTVERTFFIENESTWSVYYRIYLDDVSGGLADVLQITVLDGERVLYQDTVSNLKQDNVLAADDTLQIGERRDLTVRFHFPEEAGNSYQGQSLSFTLCAQATQTKNNPGKVFG